MILKRMVIVLIGLFLCIGCGISSHDVFTSVCTEETHSEGFQWMKSYEMTYQDDVISHMVVEYHYVASNQIGLSTLEAVKMSFLNDTNKYQSIEGFHLEVEKDESSEYLAKYLLDFTVMSPSDIEKFGFSKDYIKQIRMFKEQKKSCK